MFKLQTGYLRLAMSCVAICSCIGSPAAAVLPAQHQAPAVEDKHAAEVNENNVIECVAVDAALQKLLSPYSDVWEKAPSRQVQLFPQSLVAPVGGGGTAQVDVRALRNLNGIAFRLEWTDSTQDTGRSDSKFKDAIAIEFPVDSSGDTRLAMGHSGGPVNILLWTADTSTVRKDGSMQAEELVAAGIYNRARKETKYQLLQVGSNWRARKWEVVIFKPFNDADLASPKFSQGAEIPMALAVWNGSENERLGLKSVSSWNLLRIK